MSGLYAPAACQRSRRLRRRSGGPKNARSKTRRVSMDTYGQIDCIAGREEAGRGAYRGDKHEPALRDLMDSLCEHSTQQSDTGLVTRLMKKTRMSLRAPLTLSQIRGSVAGELLGELRDEGAGQRDGKHYNSWRNRARVGNVPRRRATRRRTGGR